VITKPNWQTLVSDVAVLARPSGLWTLAVEYVAGPRKVKIVARPKETWKISADVSSGADGDLSGSTDPSAGTCLFPAVLRGALIGKIGGSAADNTVPVGTPGAAMHPTTIPTPFAVGSFCIIDILAEKRGSLFLTMNDAPASFAQHEGQIVVDIYYAI
jgi:hypothetical protein